MKLHDLLKNREENNVIYDFSDFTRDELMLFVNSQIYGEDSLTDAEMQELEAATAKIKTKPGTPRKCKPLPPQHPGEDTCQWLNRALLSQWDD